MSAALRRSVESLNVPNYRRYFYGQIVSLSGNWMQMVAEIWLVLSLTNSGFAVGLTTALQFVPVIFLGAWGGLLADRFPKRRLLMITQVTMAVPALTLFAITLSGAVEVWMVMALVFVRGAINSIDNPVRQSFAIEMVGADRVVNAVSLNSVLVHCARMVGPALAGVLIATVGVAACFGLNALTFAAMFAALWRMDPRQLRPAPRGARGEGAIRAAVRHVLRTPELAVPLGLMALLGTFGFNFQVILPLLARFTFDGGASAYATLVAAMGVGAVIGALVTGARGRTDARLIVGAALAFGIFSGLAAVAPNMALEVPLVALLGAAAVTFAAAINSTLQLAVEAEMRGRVMALYTVVFLGSTPIGAPLTGWLAEAYDPRVALVLTAVAGVAAAWAGHVGFARVRARRRAAPRPQRAAERYSTATR